MVRFVILAIASTLLLIGCSEEVPDVPPMRETVAIEYVSAEAAVVRKSPQPTAPEVARISNAEPVSVLAYGGTWAEVRTGTGTGWVERAQLAPKVEVAKLESTRDKPRFRQPPMPVTSPGPVSGEIVLEAQVNSEGQVVSVRTLSNTTGSTELEERNTAEFRKSSFYPMMVNGKKKPFFYYHRVSY